MEFRSEFGALQTAQQSKVIPEGDPPGQAARAIGHFHCWIIVIAWVGQIFIRILMYIFHELAGFSMI
jgi:hypothetical protein